MYENRILPDLQIVGLYCILNQFPSIKVLCFSKSNYQMMIHVQCDSLFHLKDIWFYAYFMPIFVFWIVAHIWRCDCDLAAFVLICE